jgi:hypothetical protein
MQAWYPEPSDDQLLSTWHVTKVHLLQKFLDPQKHALIDNILPTGGNLSRFILSNPNISIGLHRCYFFFSHELIITWYYRLYFIYVRVCLFLCSAHIELGH